MKLMNANGTTLRDGRHDLVVYKVAVECLRGISLWGGGWALVLMSKGRDP